MSEPVEVDEQKNVHEFLSKIEEQYETNRVFVILGLIGLIISIIFGFLSFTGKFISESDSSSIIIGSMVLFFISLFFIFLGNSRKILKKENSYAFPPSTQQNSKVSNSGGNKGQMQLSFGMIFSIILIITFLVFAFFAIGKFLDIQNSIQVGKFKDKLQTDIDKLWKGTQGSQTVLYNLPSSVKKVCFVDFSISGRGVNLNLYSHLKSSFYGSENLVFYPVGSAQGLDSAIINHIYLDEIVKSENPYCIDVSDGDVNIHLEKDYGQATVLITR